MDQSRMHTHVVRVLRNDRWAHMTVLMPEPQRDPARPLPVDFERLLSFATVAVGGVPEETATAVPSEASLAGDTLEPVDAVDAVDALDALEPALPTESGETESTDATPAALVSDVAPSPVSTAASPLPAGTQADALMAAFARRADPS